MIGGRGLFCVLEWLIWRLLRTFFKSYSGRVNPDTDPHGSNRILDLISIGVLTRVFNRDIVDEVVISADRGERRRRLLPARVVVYYVLALALFYGDAYEEVMRKLVNGLRSLQGWGSEWNVPTSSAITQARKRLGETPLRLLFERVAVPLARPGTRGAWYRNWRVMSIDGVVLDTQDTPENESQFGRSANHKAESPFPQVRVVGLAECGTHAIVAASIGSYRNYERELTRDLLPQFSAGMLVLADRGFYGFELWKEAIQSGADLLWRVSTRIDIPVLQALADGSYLSSVAPAHMRSDIKRGKGRRIDLYEIPVRVVDYTVENRSNPSEVIRLIITILDPVAAPAEDLAALYQERWEFEIGLDEIETHQMGRPRVLRSKLPDLVRQEIWSFLLVHYAIRSFMIEAADDIGEDPDRLSFIRSLRVIRRQVSGPAAFSP